MDSLEKASIDGDIEPITVFISRLVRETLKGRPIATIYFFWDISTYKNGSENAESIK
jgi:hypothetical protein